MNPNDFFNYRTNTYGTLDPLAKALNGIGVYVFIFVVVELFLNNFYIIPIFILLSRLTFLIKIPWVDNIMLVISIVYLLILEKNIEAVGIIVFIILTIVSFLIERENIKRTFNIPPEFLQDKEQISPKYIIVTFLNVLFFILALSLSEAPSLVFGILFGMISIYRIFTNIAKIYFEYKYRNERRNF
ncbi:MAG: hypothetical protein J0M18_16980 [Ignavibacteria bacterium]|nr:hypothetical protein [Ignavibacteria bacterium]